MSAGANMHPKWVAFDINEKGEECNHMYGFTDKPEKIYETHIDCYGDKRDKYRLIAKNKYVQCSR